MSVQGSKRENPQAASALAAFFDQENEGVQKRLNIDVRKVLGLIELEVV